MAPDDVPLPLLERYAIGQCTPEDLVELEAWIDGQPERRLFINRLQSLFAHPADRDVPVTFTETEIEHAWARVAERMSARASRDRARAAWRRRIAAVVAGLVAAWLLWLALVR
ncbi:MAG TPA: hypothetical protein VGR59_09410 [Gemmatimonadaceae bacterium]|nr:hypothetical protein [Gemmatimonadaceae bacterium]